jgi:2-(1,2-epoxy-1,2-dihydrophenyl)acetyl-CoA isomerase
MTETSDNGSSTTVLVQRRSGVATVTINRPERRNALTTAVKDALRDALSEVSADVSVRAVVLTGAGGHFCAGQDLAEHAVVLESDTDRAFATVAQHYAPIVSALATMPKPVVAAVEGICVGAGLGFALACDLRVVSRAATLSTAFSSIGLTCDSGLAHSLPRAIGEARARELVLLAEPFSGERAHALGLVTRLAEPSAALSLATDLAVLLAAGPTSAYAESKRLLAESCSRTLDATLRDEAAAQRRAGATNDHRAAVRAFLGKRKPEFIGA